MTFDATLEQALGSRPRDASSAPNAGVVELCDGRRVFVKAPRDPRAHAMVDAEEHGLAFLRGRSALRVPSVLARGADFLVLDTLELCSLGGASAERFGQALADLHRSGAPSFGLDRDNFIGLTEQRNTPHARWADFYRDERILAVARRCRLDPGTRARRHRRGAHGSARRGRRAALAPPWRSLVWKRMRRRAWDALRLRPRRLRSEGRTSATRRRLQQIGPRGLVLPGGSRELDLAMMRLFSGFSRRTFDAYDESFPLLTGHEERVALYQLYFLLVHVAIFGEGYVAQTVGCLRTILRR